jgi:hypothetical protein
VVATVSLSEKITQVGSEGERPDDGLHEIAGERALPDRGDRLRDRRAPRFDPQRDQGGPELAR